MFGEAAILNDGRLVIAPWNARGLYVGDVFITGPQVRMPDASLDAHGHVWAVGHDQVGHAMHVLLVDDHEKWFPIAGTAFDAARTILRVVGDKCQVAFASSASRWTCVEVTADGVVTLVATGTIPTGEGAHGMRDWAPDGTPRPLAPLDQKLLGYPVRSMVSASDVSIACSMAGLPDQVVMAKQATLGTLALGGIDWWTPRLSADGSHWCGVSFARKEVKSGAVPQLPPALVTPPETIPTIAKACSCAWFFDMGHYGDDPNAPCDWSIVVDTGVVTAKPVIISRLSEKTDAHPTVVNLIDEWKDRWAQVAGVYITTESGPLDQEATMANARMAALGLPRKPLYSYTDADTQAGLDVAAIDYVGVTCYLKPGETEAEAEHRWRNETQKVLNARRTPWFIGQGYKADSETLNRLMRLFAEIVRAANCETVLGWFAWLRPDGGKVHGLGPVAVATMNATTPMAVPQGVSMTAKARIKSFVTPIFEDEVSRAVAEPTQGTPQQYGWQWQRPDGGWETGALNQATDIDHSYNRANLPRKNKFPGPGHYNIRLQTFVNGVMTDQSSSTSRTVEVKARVTPPEPPDPNPPQPPTPGPGQVVVHVTDSKTGAAIAEADTWSQLTPGAIVKTDVNGYALITASSSGVCAKKDGYHSPGLPEQAQTCKVLAPTIELALQPVPPPVPPARQGLVQSSGHALRDDGGLWFALGATAFWYLGGYITDQPRVIQHCDWWRGKGADYLRNLCHASGSGANAFDPNFRSNFDGLVGLQYEHGLRTFTTIFGQHNGTEEQRQAVVNTVRDIALAHPERFLGIEIANEAYGNDFPIEEARKYAKQLLAELPHQIAVSAPEQDGCDDTKVGTATHRGQKFIYGGLTPIGKVLVTLHYARRTTGDSGLWDPCTQPWRGGHQFCLGGGERISDNEGIGPTSSVNQDNDPRRLATTIAVDIIGGGACHVVHVGSGVTGKVDPARNRPANAWEEVNIDAIMTGIVAVRDLFPGNAPNWTRGGSKDGPWSCDTLGDKGTLDRLYCSWNNVEARGAAVNLRKDTVLTARQHVNTTVHDSLDGRVLQQADLAKGQSFTLRAVAQGVILKGAF